MYNYYYYHYNSVYCHFIYIYFYLLKKDSFLWKGIRRRLCRDNHNNKSSNHILYGNMLLFKI